MSVVALCMGLALSSLIAWLISAGISLLCVPKCQSFVLTITCSRQCRSRLFYVCFLRDLSFASLLDFEFAVELLLLCESRDSLMVSMTYYRAWRVLDTFCPMSTSRFLFVSPIVVSLNTNLSRPEGMALKHAWMWMLFWFRHFPYSFGFRHTWGFKSYFFKWVSCLHAKKPSIGIFVALNSRLLSL